MHAQSKQKPITIFSVLALVVLLIGGAGAIIFRFWAIDNWMRSGEGYEVGVWHQIEFTGPGDQFIFFESPQSQLPSEHGAITLDIDDPGGSGVTIERLTPDVKEAFTPRVFLPTTDRSGRLLWRVNVITPGVYQFRVVNYHEPRFPEDRIVWGKNPPTRRALNQQVNVISFSVLGLTGLAVVALYVMHAITLSKRRAAAGDAGEWSPLEPMG